MLPPHKLLLAHHNKIFMEFLRSGFADESLKTVKSWCYGSWMDAVNYDSGFPVVIKQTSSSGGAGVFLATNRKEFNRKVKKAGKIIIADNLKGLFNQLYKNECQENCIIFFPREIKISEI